MRVATRDVETKFPRRQFLSGKMKNRLVSIFIIIREVCVALFTLSGNKSMKIIIYFTVNNEGSNKSEYFPNLESCVHGDLMFLTILTLLFYLKTRQ